MKYARAFGTAFLVGFIVMVFLGAIMACSSQATLATERASAVATINGPNATDAQKSSATRIVDMIDKGIEAADKQATADSEAVKDAAEPIGALLPVAGTLGAALAVAATKWISKQRALDAVVQSIQAAKYASPEFNTAFENVKPVIEQVQSLSNAHNAVAKSKKKMKPVNS